MTTMREQSRCEWAAAITREDINAGSLQRIADAVEAVAKNYTAIINERERLKQRLANEEACSARLVRSNNALRGVIKRMKGGGE
jgi:hypothetical protein